MSITTNERAEFTAMMNKASDEIESLRAENARLKADADRYRKLKAHMTFTDISGYSATDTQSFPVIKFGPTTRRWYHDSSDLFATTLDAAIDAMKADQSKA